MNFNTANQTFRQLLGNGLVYRVTPFQRDYSWAEDEWDDLWQDMLGLLEPDGEPAHYMGHLVLQSPDSKRFDIIDAQQRLTTISVMMLAALGHLKDLVGGGDTKGQVDRFVEDVTIVPHFDANRVHVHDGIDGIQRSILPISERN